MVDLVLASVVGDEENRRQQIGQVRSLASLALVRAIPGGAAAQLLLLVLSGAADFLGVRFNLYSCIWSM